MHYRIPDISLADDEVEGFRKKFEKAFAVKPEPITEKPEPVAIAAETAKPYPAAAMPISDAYCRWDTEFFKTHSPYEFGEYYRRKVAGRWEIRLEPVTVQRGKALLAIGNRRTVWPEEIITRIATGMAEGRWRWRQLPVRLDDDGAVVSGSLYLEAGVRAKTTIYVPIIFGCTEVKVKPKATGPTKCKLKISDDEVRTIRNLAADGIRTIDLVRKYGVSRGTICNIISRKTRRNVA